MRIRLTLGRTESSDPPNTYVFDQEVVLIGRAGDNDLALDDPDSVVSKRHAKVRVAAGSITVEDLGSKNFTFVNGRRLPAGAPKPVAPGDRIEIGGFSLGVEPEDAPARDLEQTVFAAGFTNPFLETAESLADAFGKMRRSIVTSDYPRRDEALRDALREAMGPGDEVESLVSVLLGEAPTPQPVAPPATGPMPEPPRAGPEVSPSGRSTPPEDPFANPPPLDAGVYSSSGQQAEADPFATPPPQQGDPFATPPPQQGDPFATPPPQKADPFAMPPPKKEDPFAMPSGGAPAGGRADDPFAMPQRPPDPFASPSVSGDPFAVGQGGGQTPSPQPVASSPRAPASTDLVDRLLQIVTRLVGIPWQFRHEFIGHTILHTPETAFLYDGDAHALRAYLTEGPDSAEHLRLLDEAAEQVVLHQVAMLAGYRAAAEAGAGTLLDAVDPDLIAEGESENAVGKLLAGFKGSAAVDRIREKVQELRSESVSVLERRFFRPAFIDAYLARLANRRGPS